MSSFLPIQPCCLEGQTLPGTPVGEYQASSSSRTIGRYHAKPKDGGIVDEKAALILFYDLFGLKIPNPKIMADAFADRLGINVFVVDYIPNPPEPGWVDNVVESKPHENANKSWFQTIKDIMYLVYKIVPLIPSIRSGKLHSVTLKAVQEIRAEGFEKVGGIGYCRGGSIVTYLMSSPSNPLDCGVICHPQPDMGMWSTINKPTQWHLASHDRMFTDAKVAQLVQTFEPKQKGGVEFSYVVHQETTHGFAARPNLAHEPSRKGFEKVADDSIEFFKQQLLTTR